MEGNRDESERCMKLAEDYIKLGLTEKAKKFIHKAERLYPSKRAKGVLSVCEVPVRHDMLRKGCGLCYLVTLQICWTNCASCIVYPRVSL